MASAASLPPHRADGRHDALLLPTTMADVVALLHNAASLMALCRARQRLAVAFMLELPADLLATVCGLLPLPTYVVAVAASEAVEAVAARRWAAAVPQLFDAAITGDHAAAVRLLGDVHATAT
eukprot:COSAG06_NODE_23470_length_691_cov_0.646959_1_plen_122_part_10